MKKKDEIVLNDTELWFNENKLDWMRPYTHQGSRKTLSIQT